MSNQNNEIPYGFKQTEIGVIPEDWEVVKLGDVYEIQQGKALSPKSKKGISPRPFIRTSNVLWGKIDLSHIDYMDFDEKEVQKYELKENDLLVCEGGEIGRTAIWKNIEGTYCYQNHLHRLRSKTQNVYPLFTMYWMQAAFLLLRLYLGTGNVTTIPNLSRSRLSNFLIPLPPLPEQKKIAYVLSVIQEAKEKTEAVIKATKELKKSLMKYLFTYGPVPLDEAENVKLKETEIGLIPEDWEVVKLGDVYEIQQGKALSPKSKKGISPRPFIRTSNVLWGKIDLSHIDYMDFDEKEVQKYELKENDLLVCEGGEIGRTAIWKNIEGTYCYQNHLHRLRSKTQNVYPLFTMYWMQAAFLLLRLYLGTGNVTTIPNLSRSRLSNFLIPLPPLPIQQKIASILSAVDKKIEREENKKKALEELFKSMLHNLMTGKVRVKNLDIKVDENVGK